MSWRGSVMSWSSLASFSLSDSRTLNDGKVIEDELSLVFTLAPIDNKVQASLVAGGCLEMGKHKKLLQGNQDFLVKIETELRICYVPEDLCQTLFRAS